MLETSAFPLMDTWAFFVPFLCPKIIWDSCFLEPKFRDWFFVTKSPLTFMDRPFRFSGIYVYTENTIWHFFSLQQQNQNKPYCWTVKKIWYGSPGDFWTQKHIFNAKWFPSNWMVNIFRKPHEMQNMSGCVQTFGQIIPSFCAWCDKFLVSLTLSPLRGSTLTSKIVLR